MFSVVMGYAEGGIHLKWRYDVFLCFRSDDTRRNFTSTLYDALLQAKLRTFMYNGSWKGGDEIASIIYQAIETSRISIVVLSPNFAESTWCLNDLVKILDCNKTNNQLVLPIFYDVDPSDVRHQEKDFERCISKQENRFRSIDGGSLILQQWRSALRQVTDFSGRHFRSGHEYEYRFIEDIVAWITKNVPRYDVFLSCSGQDTRYSFTGFLYNALCKSGFRTYMNDGDQISHSTIQAIEKSRLSIIVFSVNYARSSSYLDELLTILECMKKNQLVVWPVFYKVEPSDLRHQRKSFDEAMTEHENMLGKDSLKVKNWRAALVEVAHLKGWHLKIGYEYELIEKIVEMAINI